MHLFCGQAGYAPGEDQHWEIAWTLLGSCVGSRTPTSSPNYVTLSDLGGCPEEWEEKNTGGAYYEEGDRVSSKGLVFTCKRWPYSGHCGQQGYGPLVNPVADDWKHAWELTGHCSGSRSPTTSPVFVTLAVSASGCPAEYSDSFATYDAGDLVALTVSIKPERKIVYKCLAFPNTGFCNLSGFRPGSQYGHMAWKQTGACSGTLTPTAAPVVYGGLCKYSKCVELDSTEQCTPGSVGCSCNANDTAGSSCQRDIKRVICNDVNVNHWSNSFDYTGGDVVRIGSKRFKCRAWPFMLWCNVEGYKPMLENGIWDQAWSEDGTCT